jgi:hypothetical protein
MQLSERQIYVRYHVSFTHVRTDIDIMKENRKTSNLFTRSWQPVMIQIRRRLIIVTGTNISSERTPVAWNYLIYDSEGIGLDVAVDGEAEIDVVVGRRRPARIRIMNAITPMSERV